MANASVYVIRSTMTPGTQLRVSRNEYENLVELNLIAALDEVIVPVDQVIVSATVPPTPPVGTVWFNTTIP